MNWAEVAGLISKALGNGISAGTVTYDLARLTAKSL